MFAKQNWRLIIAVIFLIVIEPFKSNASGLSLIRDAEIEDFLYDLTKPIFIAAGLNPDDIKIYIVNESSINAFVAGGQNVFINTGLITKYSDPNVLIGVIAHETGHITSGHLARSSEDIQSANNTMLTSYILGIAAAATASPDAGMAMIMGGSQIAERFVLKFTRTQEEAADSVALKYLKQTKNSADGLLEILEFFDREEEYKGKIDEYALTHPVSKKRISFIKANAENFAKKDNKKMQERLEKVIAKLGGFLNEPDQTLKLNAGNDSNSKYARIIAYHKKGNSKEAIKILNELIKNDSTNCYLFDLQGQILFESGDLTNSIIAYNQTIKLCKSNNLARIALATAIINLNSSDKKLTDFAIQNLLTALQSEKSDINAYKQLSLAYNQNGDLGRSYLALAELNLLEENQEKIKKYVKLAKENLDKNDKISLLHLDDIEQFAKDIKDKK